MFLADINENLKKKKKKLNFLQKPRDFTLHTSTTAQREVDQNYECLKICPINQTCQNKVGVIDPSGALANVNCENHT